MEKREYNLKDLGAKINKKVPFEMQYDLGTGEDKSEFIATYMNDEMKSSVRIDSSPNVRLYESKGKTLMDITDSDANSDKYSYEGLTPHNAIYEKPKYVPDDLGTLVIDLNEDGSERLAITQFLREE